MTRSCEPICSWPLPPPPPHAVIIPCILGCRHLKSVRILDLSNNQISVVENLQNMYKLEFLSLSRNRITSGLELWRVVGNLTVLSLAHNLLDTTKGFELMMGLKELDLRDNLILDVNGVSYLGSLPLLTDLWLAGNPFSAEKDSFLRVHSLFSGPSSTKLQLDDRRPTPEEVSVIDELRRHRRPPELLESREPEPLKAKRKPTVVRLHGERPGWHPEHDAVTQRPLPDHEDDNNANETEDKEPPLFLSPQTRKNSVSWRSVGLSTDTLSQEETEEGVHESLDTLSQTLLATELAGENFQRKIEEMRKEGGTAWLNIFRELQVDNAAVAQADQPSPLTIGEQESASGVSVAPFPPSVQDSLQAERGGLSSSPKRITVEDIFPPKQRTPESVGSSAAHVPDNQQEEGLHELPATTEQRTEEEVPFISLLTAQVMREGETLKKSAQDPNERGGTAAVITGEINEAKGRCMVCSSVFFKHLKAGHSLKREILCPVCDSDYIVDYLGSHDSEEYAIEALKGIPSREQAPQEETPTPPKIPRSDSLKIGGRKQSQKGFTPTGTPSTEDAGSPPLTESVSGLMTSFLRSSTMKLKDALPTLMEGNSSTAIPTGRTSVRGSLNSGDGGDEKVSSSPVGFSTLEQIFSEDFDPNEHDLPSMAVDKDRSSVLHPNLLLYFDLKIFTQEGEAFVAFMHTSVVTLSREGVVFKERGVFLLISTHKLCLLNRKMRKGSSLPEMGGLAPEKLFRMSTEPRRFSDLYRIDVGLGHQSLTFHFKNSSLGLSDEVESFTFLLRDPRLTSELLERLTTIVAHLAPPKNPLSLLGGTAVRARQRFVYPKLGSLPVDPPKVNLEEEDGSSLNPLFGGYKPPERKKTADATSSSSLFHTPATLYGHQFIKFDVTDALDSFRMLVIVEEDPAFDGPLEKLLIDYTLVYHTSTLAPDPTLPRAFAATETYLYLCEEVHMNHPLFLQDSPPPTPRFVRKAVRSLLELARVEISDGPYFRARIVFEEEHHPAADNAEVKMDLPCEANVWELLLFSKWAQQRLLSVLRGLWRQAYHINLEVVDVSL